VFCVCTTYAPSQRIIIHYQTNDVGGRHGREVGDLYHSHVLHAERPACHVLHRQEVGHW
jgi:hypothetical protein